MEKLIKQPNGKYCITDYSGNIKHYNLTEQDIINMYIEEAKSHIGTAEHYSNLIAKTVSVYSRKTNDIPNNILKKMGFDKTYDELVKFVPRTPIDTQYASCDFTTYGKCPHCGGRVQNGIGFTEKKCSKCGQILRW